MCFQDTRETGLRFDIVFNATLGYWEFAFLPKSKYSKRHPALIIATGRVMHACKTEYLNGPAVSFNAHFCFSMCRYEATAREIITHPKKLDVHSAHMYETITEEYRSTGKRLSDRRRFTKTTCQAHISQSPVTLIIRAFSIRGEIEWSKNMDILTWKRERTDLCV